MKTKIAIVGLGGIATSEHIPGILKNDSLEIVAICDINEKKFEYAEKCIGHACTRYLDYRELMKDPEIEVVHVTTPNYLHSEISCAALASGKHVLCEKPDAVNLNAALAMQVAEKASGKTLMVMRNNRFNASTAFLQERIARGAMGELYTGRCGWIRRRGIPGKGGWFTNNEQSGGGPLIDLGVHMIDLAMYLMGNPVPVAVSGATYCKFAESDVSDSVHAKFGEKSDEGIFDVEDLATGFIRFADGRTLQIEFSWASNIEREKYFVELRGTKEGFSMEDGACKVFGEDNGFLTDLLPKIPSTSGHASYIRHFYQVIRGKEKPIFTMEQGVNMIRILQAVYESAKTGKEVRMTEKK